MQDTTSNPMRLSFPTDRLILEELAKGRNTGATISEQIDRHRTYVNSRMAQLHDYGLTKKIGDSGVYELTERGAAVIAVADRYDEVDDFEALVDEVAERVSISPFSYEIVDE